jgi:hypothetical protein
MAKAIIKYNLADPEDQQEFYRATKALSMALAIWEFDQYLRGEYKHNENEPAYAFRNKFREFLADNDIDIDKVLH